MWGFGYGRFCKYSVTRDYLQPNTLGSIPLDARNFVGFKYKIAISQLISLVNVADTNLFIGLPG